MFLLEEKQVKMGPLEFRKDILAYTKAYMNILQRVVKSAVERSFDSKL